MISSPNHAPAIREVRKTVDQLLEFNGKEADVERKKRLVVGARRVVAHEVEKIIKEQVILYCGQIFDIIEQDRQVPDPHTGCEISNPKIEELFKNYLGVLNLSGQEEYEVQAAKNEALVSINIAKLLNQENEYATQELEKKIERAVELINLRISPVIDVEQGDLTGEVKIKKKLDDYGEKNDFENAIRESVKNAFLSQLCYEIDSRIHKLNEVIKNLAKRKAGSIIFGSDLLSLIDQNLPVENLLEKRELESIGNEEFANKLEKEIET